MTARFPLRRLDQGSRSRVIVEGDVDLDTGRTLSDAVGDTAARAGCDHVVIDLHGVSFLGAAGVRGLLCGIDQARRHGCTCSVAVPAGLVRTVLDMTGVLQVIDVERVAVTAPEVQS